MEERRIPCRTEDGNDRFCIDIPLFASGPNWSDSADAKFFLEAELIIRIDRILFPAKTPADGQPDAARGQIKQVGRVNVQVQCPEFGGKKTPRSQRREIDQWHVGCDRPAEVIKRIVRRRLSDIIPRERIKERIIRIQNPLEARAIDVLNLRNLLNLAVHDRSIVAPVPTEELVTPRTDREPLGDVFVIDQAVAKIGDARARTARDDLLKRVERIERARRHPNLGRTGPTKWWNSSRKRMIRWDENHKTARGLETARGIWGQFIVRFSIHIIEIGVNPELIVQDLGFESSVATPAFLFRVGNLERVKVKAR